MPRDRDDLQDTHPVKFDTFSSKELTFFTASFELSRTKSMLQARVLTDSDDDDDAWYEELTNMRIASITAHSAQLERRSSSRTRGSFASQRSLTGEEWFSRAMDEDDALAEEEAEAKRAAATQAAAADESLARARRLLDRQGAELWAAANPEATADAALQASMWEEIALKDASTSAPPFLRRKSTPVTIGIAI